MKCTVYAVSGRPGSGKTTLVHGIADRVPGCVALHNDDYWSQEKLTRDLRPWLAAGADLSDWSDLAMADDVRALRSGDTITHPKTGERLGPACSLVLEAPAGRLDLKFRDLIDTMVCIDTPADIALARQALWIASLPDCTADTAVGYLRHYENCVRDVGLAFHRQFMPTADIVLDGAQPPGELADHVAKLVAGDST